MRGHKRSLVCFPSPPFYARPPAGTSRETSPRPHHLKNRSAAQRGLRLKVRHGHRGQRHDKASEQPICQGRRKRKGQRLLPQVILGAFTNAVIESIQKLPQCLRVRLANTTLGTDRGDQPRASALKLALMVGLIFL